MTLHIHTLGALAIAMGGQTLALPASRKTRALLGFLVLTGRPHRRERLCEMFWDRTDDPKAALRWSLSKLRPLIHADGRERLLADRERVAIETTDCVVDRLWVAERLSALQLDRHTLSDLIDALDPPLLDGTDLPDCALYQAWLTAARDEIFRERRTALRRLAFLPGLDPLERLAAARQWSDADPYCPDAATHLVAMLTHCGKATKARQTTEALTARFADAGIPWSAQRGPDPAAPPTTDWQQAQGLLHQPTIRSCRARYGGTVAYA